MCGIYDVRTALDCQKNIFWGWWICKEFLEILTTTKIDVICSITTTMKYFYLFSFPQQYHICNVKFICFSFLNFFSIPMFFCRCVTCHTRKRWCHFIDCWFSWKHNRIGYCVRRIPELLHLHRNAVCCHCFALCFPISSKSKSYSFVIND